MLLTPYAPDRYQGPWKVKVWGVDQCQPLLVRVTLIARAVHMGVGDRVTFFGPRPALRMIERTTAWHRLSPLHQFCEEHFNLQQYYTEVSESRNDAFRVIEEVIGQIDQAHRFVGSKQGLKIREFLDKRLLDLDPSYSERREDPPTARWRSQRKERVAR